MSILEYYEKHDKSLNETNSENFKQLLKRIKLSKEENANMQKLFNCLDINDEYGHK